MQETNSDNSTARSTAFGVILKSNYLTRSEKASEFIELLVSKLDKITTHSYIAKSQASYFLKKTKNK